MNNLSSITSIPIAITFASLSVPLAAQSPENSKPNVVYIISDDLGYGDLSCYGQKHFKTPNIDKLATDGIRFTSHYSGSTVCAPSRSCLMTGQDTGHTYIRGNGDHQLRDEDFTLAEVFKKAGYATGMVGKSCVAGNGSDPQAPHLAGFDYFWGTLSHKTAHWHYPKNICTQGEKITIEGNNGKTGTTYIQDEYTERAVEFIEKSKDDPFFLLLSFSVPHASLQAPQEAIDPHIGKMGKDKSYKGGHYLAVKHIKATHAAMITRMDEHVGIVVDKLTELGLDKNTIVCFTSDNGSHVEGGFHYSMMDSNGVLKGGKRDLYEGGIRVPFIVKWPSTIKAGATSDHPSAFWDFLPTICDIVDVEKPTDIQGISFLPTLKSNNEEQKQHPYLYWEFSQTNGRVALRQGDWKIVRYNILGTKKKSSYELYNLKDDLSEKNNLAKKHPEKIEEMRKLIKSAHKKSPVELWNFTDKL